MFGGVHSARSPLHLLPSFAYYAELCRDYDASVLLLKVPLGMRASCRTLWSSVRLQSEPFSTMNAYKCAEICFSPRLSVLSLSLPLSPSLSLSLSLSLSYLSHASLTSPSSLQVPYQSRAYKTSLFLSLSLSLSLYLSLSFDGQRRGRSSH